MIHEVLPDRFMMYVNQAHNIYIKTSRKSAQMLVEKITIQHLGFLG